MLVLIIGGSGSGKSAYGERLLEELDGNWHKYYIAAMEAADEESRQRVERHRRQRAGKGFITVEQPRNVQLAAAAMDAAADAVTGKRGFGRAALLECVSNLTANEMFGQENPLSAAAAADKVCGNIGELAEKLEFLIVVTNNVFEDGGLYDESITAYLEAMGRINERLAAMADVVTEVVAGIPVPVKQTGHHPLTQTGLYPPQQTGGTQT